jgi:hypothetical protein
MKNNYTYCFTFNIFNKILKKYFIIINMSYESSFYHVDYEPKGYYDYEPKGHCDLSKINNYCERLTSFSLNEVNEVCQTETTNYYKWDNVINKYIIYKTETIKF